MRPRYLEIEGLQSFKEAQKVNFDHLGEMGMFGIFGPTGSGKSTILDAITLALYGNVQRANRGTQGIINTDSQGMKVIFSFDLVKDKIRRTYRVERVYKRKKDSDSAVEAKLTRIFEISEDGEIILADKQSEVNSFIIELLGLQFDDFTRTVVLPQNKFQDFLLSTKAEKTKMLEKIFYLEEYGRQLTDRVNRSLGGVKHRLSGIIGGMTALGDISLTSLEGAGERMKKALSHKEKMDEALKNMEIQYRQAHEVWNLTVELKAVCGKEQTILSHSGEMREKQKQYEKAVQADALKGLVRAYQETEMQFNTTNMQWKEADNKLAALNDDSTALQKLYDAKSNLLKQELPRLIAYKTRLDAAVVLKKELLELEEKIKKLREDFLLCKDSMDKMNFSIEKCRKELEVKLSTKEEDGKRIEALKIDLQYKKEVQAGLKREEELKRLEQESNVLEQRKQKLALSITELRNNLAAASADRQQLLEMLPRLNSERDALIKSRNQQEAYELAKGLKPGDTCPVCGSTEHPRLADKSNAVVLEQLEADIKASEAACAAYEPKLREADSACIKLETLYESQAASLEQAVIAWEEFDKNLKEKRQQFGELLKRLGLTNMKQEAERIEKCDYELETHQRQVAKQDADITELRKKLEELLLERQRLEGKRADIEAEGKSTGSQKQEKEQKINEIAALENIDTAIIETERQINKLNQDEHETLLKLQQTKEKLNYAFSNKAVLEKQKELLLDKLQKENEKIAAAMKEKNFISVEDVLKACISKTAMEQLEKEISQYNETRKNLEIQKAILIQRLDNRALTEEQWQQLSITYDSMRQEKETAIAQYEQAKNEYVNFKNNYDKWIVLVKSFEEYNRRKDYLEQIQRLLKGNGFIEFISEERLRYIAKEATETLGLVTKYKYALELDTENGFVIVDNANGGARRQVSSLSGGEIFLTSLSLALALSSQIQLKGQSPLEFFFLDEGFGTLDNELLDTVIDALERLSTQRRIIGLISHVPELRNRIPRQLIVEPPTIDGSGTRVRLERA